MVYRHIHRLLFCLFTILCIIIVIESKGLGVYRGFIGDICIIMLLYSFFMSIGDFSLIRLTLFVVLIGYFFEFLQYLRILDSIDWNNNKILILILGSVYDPLDLIAYTLGGILIYLLDRYYIRIHFSKKLG